MEVFVSSIPPHCTDRDLRSFFREPLAEFNITVFLCEKFGAKPCAKLVFREVSKGQQFLAKYGIRPGQQRPVCPLKMNRSFVRCTISRNKPNEFLLSSLASDAARSARPPVATRNRQISTFEFTSLQCGMWSFVDDRLVFTSYFIDTRAGRIVFGHHSAALLFNSDNADRTSATRVDINYYDIDTATTGSSQSPSVTFTLDCPPKFYRAIPELDALIAGLNLNTRKPRFNKARVPAISPMHAHVASSCFVYQIRLTNYVDLAIVLQSLQHNRNINSTVSHPTRTVVPAVNLKSSFGQLDLLLTDYNFHGAWSFDVKFQLLRLARNGALFPEMVIRLLPTVEQLLQHQDEQTVVSAIQHLYQSLQPIGPHTQAVEYAHTTIVGILEGYARDYDSFQSQNFHDIANRHAHIVLIHKLTVTPAGVYLEGPEPEVSNRVLRKYEKYANNFIRVTFIDEDGESVRYDPRSDQEEVYGRFKAFMDTQYIIAGRGFSFLGFSHSSLRSQTCWFMAPFQFEGSLMYAPTLIRGLGNFSHIRSPARCAARIGQAFSDTTGTVEVEADILGHLPDVERNGRCFSDGCGTISLSLLKKVWRVYQVRRTLKPTILQIRYAGAKGVVSLDSRLAEDQFNIRPSMEKFNGSGAVTLEVCGAAWRPYPMILNRQFIKILEDLQVPLAAFMSLQNKAVENLRMMTSTLNASAFLHETQTSKSARLPELLEIFASIGLDYFNDPFLRSIVEMAVITKLRDIKYRGRIPVKNGITLYGILDETGYLQENQIYVTVKDSIDEDKRVLSGGKVIVTRSPALHPGDIRLAEAIDVPADSPLDKLHNCVVFSQHGARDLPSQLSGGDLDGDLYNVIFDPSLMPRRDIADPADYPNVKGVELPYEVTVQDMSNFFVEFMQTDQLGQISTSHLQIADQRAQGVFDPDCLRLAAMASTAVDFSKTGIPVDMKACPRPFPVRPDFMAPSPRVKVDTDGMASIEDVDQDNEDDPIGELDDLRRTRYYRSEKVLGQLYRAIDEQQFLINMQKMNRTSPEKEGTVIWDLWRYIQRHTAAIQWEHHKEQARQIRDGYEQALLQALYQYASSPRHPLTETEVFSGTILGRNGGKQSPRLREATQSMREQFEEVLQFTTSRIIDGDFDEDDRNEEALPRAIACLAIGMEDSPLKDRKVGELLSWKYIAASVCLKEIRRWYVMDLKRFSLPRVY